MELLQCQRLLTGNYLAVAWQGSSLRSAYPAGLTGSILSRRCSSIWKAPALAIDVRSWPLEDLRVIDVAIRMPTSAFDPKRSLAADGFNA